MIQKRDGKDSMVSELTQKIASQLDVDGLISPAVAINENIPDSGDLLSDKVVLTFKDYKDGECEMHKLSDKKDAKSLMFKLKRLSSICLKELPSSRMIKDKIENTGNYSSLYRDLPPDVEIQEIEYGKTGRIFGYLVERYFCVVAIKVKHI